MKSKRSFFFQKFLKIFLSMSILLFLTAFSGDDELRKVSKKSKISSQIKFKKMGIARTKLSSFATIDNVGSASGLVYHKNSLFIIGDNSGFLTKYNLETKQVSTTALIENASVNIAKKQKPDFEAIALLDNKICVYGSGSTDNREQRISFDLASNEVQSKNMKNRYKKLQKAAGISDKEFNIEGVFFDGDDQYYCQRGNKSSNKNCILKYNAKTEQVDVFYFQFPLVSGSAATFTDAILLENSVYFLASAENTASTYEDGEIMGSVFGTINLKTMTLEHQEVISNNKKFEGITFFKKTGNSLHFLLCEDNDTEVLQSEITELIFKK